MNAYKWFMQTEFEASGYVTKELQAENWQKVDEFEPIYPYLSTFENAKSGDFLPVNSIAGKFLPTDLPPASTA